MADYQRIVDDLRNALISASGEPSADVIDASLSEYREACERANERLRHCENLLKKGLRGEAIQYAEIEPNLLDVVATLDFPERDVVGKTLRQIGQRLPSLHAELAGELNEAYAAQQPLEALLSRHRYLALASAPLKDRLQLLRRINEADPTNSIWSEDITVYEQERFKELHSAASQAGRTRDLPLLESCCTELTQSTWQQMPPETFKRTLLKARDVLKQTLAREQLQALEPDLNLAHGALDVSVGRTLREQWQTTAAVAQLAPDDKLLHQTAPALEWLDEQDRRDAGAASFKNACAALENMLDAETIQAADRVQLESLYHAALRHEHDLPVQLEERYRSRIASWELMTTRKSRLRMVAFVAVLVLVGGGIAFGINLQMQNKKVSAATTTLSDLVSVGKADPDAMAAAEAYHAKLRETQPELAEVPEIQQLAGEITTSIQQEQDRKHRFDEALVLAKAAGPDKPNRAALTEASELARLSAEKAAVARFQSDVAAASRAMQSQRDSEFTAEVTKLAARLREIETLGFADLNRLMIALTEAQAALDTAQAQHRDITPAAAAQLTPLTARIVALRATAERLRIERTALQAVVNTVANRTMYLDALTRYSNQHPTGGRAADFKQALAEASKWVEVEEWNHFAAKSNLIDGKNAMPDDILFLKNAATKFARFPTVEMLSARAAHYERLAARRDTGGVLKVTKLRNLFDNPLMNRAWTVKMRTGETYYVLAEPVRSATVTQNLAIVLDYALTTKNIIVPTQDVLSIASAPQGPMSIKVLAELDRLKEGDESDWEPCLASVIRTIYEAREVEPLLRLGLLKKIAETGCQGSTHMQDALSVELGLFENTEANLLVNWMDTKNQDAMLAARTAQNELKNMPDLARNADLAAATSKQSQGKTTLFPQYELLGCLLNEADGGWRCVGAGTTAAKNGRLIVMLPDAPDGLVLHEIGSLANGAVQLDITKGSELVEGRLVWVKPTP